MDFDLRKDIIQASSFSSFQKQRVKNRGFMMTLIMKPLRRLSDAKNLRRYIRGSNPIGWIPNEINFLANCPATIPDPAFDCPQELDRLSVEKKTDILQQS